MTEENRYFHLVARLEAPLWVLAICAIFVTVAVIATAFTL
jgi:hypothetical protein